MQDQYSRTQLLLGAEAMEKLHNSRVAVFGIGGVGGYTVEALARSGVGALDLIDDDKVCLTNLNRQIIATRKTVGKFKVDVAEERVHDIDPDITVTTSSRFANPEMSRATRFIITSRRRRRIALLSASPSSIPAKRSRILSGVQGV